MHFPSSAIRHHWCFACAAAEPPQRRAVARRTSRSESQHHPGSAAEWFASFPRHSTAPQACAVIAHYCFFCSPLWRGPHHAETVFAKLQAAFPDDLFSLRRFASPSSSPAPSRRSSDSDGSGENGDDGGEENDDDDDTPRQPEQAAGSPAAGSGTGLASVEVLANIVRRTNEVGWAPRVLLRPFVEAEEHFLLEAATSYRLESMQRRARCVVCMFTDAFSCASLHRNAAYLLRMCAEESAFCFRHFCSRAGLRAGCAAGRSRTTGAASSSTPSCLSRRPRRASARRAGRWSSFGRSGRGSGRGGRWRGCCARGGGGAWRIRISAGGPRRGPRIGSGSSAAWPGWTGSATRRFGTSWRRCAPQERAVSVRMRLRGISIRV